MYKLIQWCYELGKYAIIEYYLYLLSIQDEDEDEDEDTNQHQDIWHSLYLLYSLFFKLFNELL